MGFVEPTFRPDGLVDAFEPSDKLRPEEREEREKWCREANIWFTLYVELNDYNCSHASDAFYNNQLQDVSTEVLHEDNKKWFAECYHSVDELRDYFRDKPIILELLDEYVEDQN